MNRDPRSDQQLVAAANAGGEGGTRAFEQIYHRYRDWVVALAHRFTGNRDLAMDVMQETFLYLMKKFPGFTLTAQFKTFLYPVVKHLAIAANRKARRFANDTPTADAAAVKVNPAANTHSPPSSATLGHDDMAVVLSALSDDHRETLVLRFVDGLSMAEIATAMDVPPGTVKSRLHHALKQLRDDPRVRDYFGR